ncbi:hypothetical protein L6R50_01185 [Myxococcota bacterium]|nr:hypothetical protein [Myxococcota bacterium]
MSYPRIPSWPLPCLAAAAALLGPGEAAAETVTVGDASNSYQSGGNTPPWGEGTVLAYVEEGAVLDRFEYYLTLSGSRTLAFALYESPDYVPFGLYGTFSLVWTGNVTASAGTGFFSSGTVGRELTPGYGYIVGVGGLQSTDDIWYDGDASYPVDAGRAMADGWIGQATSWGPSIVVLFNVGYDAVDHVRLTWGGGVDPDDDTSDDDTGDDDTGDDDASDDDASDDDASDDDSGGDDDASDDDASDDDASDDDASDDDTGDDDASDDDTFVSADDDDDLGGRGTSRNVDCRCAAATPGGSASALALSVIASLAAARRRTSGRPGLGESA